MPVGQKRSSSMQESASDWKGTCLPVAVENTAKKFGSVLRERNTSDTLPIGKQVNVCSIEQMGKFRISR